MKLRAPVLLALAAIAAVIWFLNRPLPVDGHVSGIVEADEIRLGSRVGGRVAAVHVQEGERVVAGAALVELEPFDLNERRAAAAAELAVREAELARAVAGLRPDEVSQARFRRDALAARLDELERGPRPQEIAAGRARLESARADATLAEAEVTRAEGLVTNGVISREELERRISARAAARAGVLVAETSLALLEEGTRPEAIAAGRAQLGEADAALALAEAGYRAEEVAATRARVAAARASLEAIERALEELTVRAPLDGVIEALDLRPGDLVSGGAPVLSMLDTRRLWVRAYLPESRLNLAVGDLAHVTTTSAPATRHAAHISAIATRAEFTPGNVQTPEERSKQVFRIKVTLDEGLDVVLPGMSADVWFETVGTP
ncbi:MAG: HlyD family efflux transporter periplasmic adaptor subunit [Planctomycetota bacterium]